MLVETSDAFGPAASKKLFVGKQCAFGYRKILSQSFVSNRRLCRKMYERNKVLRAVARAADTLFYKFQNAPITPLL
ncbi:hypothetical protein ASD52_23420 [Ensifer sp. Root142]|jgi:hypothetical protein|uniref:hypothetical protein n=1 Tax=Ensifer TaxID=106591 RepID=UPI00070E2EA0|nr:MULTISPECIES: hypothetical protein [Ensifer]KQW55645.1 hypothetical protein ASD03_19010 [Ensifer sp. Root127]KQY76953.1 hypothetical protein ASD52_23420 [Ensifer sp. Root142]NOV19992.1 hypothetical protein [Ensifer canadensis]